MCASFLSLSLSLSLSFFFFYSLLKITSSVRISLPTSMSIWVCFVRLRFISSIYTNRFLFFARYSGLSAPSHTNMEEEKNGEHLYLLSWSLVCFFLSFILSVLTLFTSHHSGCNFFRLFCVHCLICNHQT